MNRVPVDNPLKVQDNLTVVHVAPPGLEVTTYLRILSPPKDAGGLHETVAEVPWADARTFKGAVGPATNLAGDDAPETGPVPALLLACTVKV